MELLNELRVGRLTMKNVAQLKALERVVTYEDGMEPSKLFPRKAEAKEENDKRLGGLPGAPKTFVAFDRASTPRTGEKLSLAAATKLLDSSILVEEKIVLKEGALVMLVKK